MEDNHKLTPIHWAIAYKHVEQLKAMIKRLMIVILECFVCFVGYCKFSDIGNNFYKASAPDFLQSLCVCVCVCVCVRVRACVCVHV